MLPADHPYTLGTATHLALKMRAASKFRESVELLRAALDTYRKVLGEDKIGSLRTAINFAVSLREASNQAEAMKLAQDTYDRFECRYGSQSAKTCIFALNLARDFEADGDLPRTLDLALDVKECSDTWSWRGPSEYARRREQPGLLPAGRRPSSARRSRSPKMQAHGCG
jgi:hypothetical protein